jgi:hypothetical protein
MRKKAFKIRQKNYHLVNETTGERVTVFPPVWPGLTGDQADAKKKNEAGEWIRLFKVVDSNGVKHFDGMSTVVLTHAPKAAPYVMIDGQRWVSEAIAKEPVAAAQVEETPAAVETAE